MKRFLVLFIFLASGAGLTQAQSFKADQQKNARVKAAYAEKWEGLKKELQQKNIGTSDFELFIRVLKNEKLVEVWLKPAKSNAYTLFKTYPICYYSGTLGPKRHEGDGQVPEGYYSVAVFNPNSNYLLSLGVSYPNASDRIIGKTRLGGDIMIHGNCLSIGCIPITDDCIKEVYILGVEARNGGQSTIPITIFPGKLDDKSMAALQQKYSKDAALLAFWKNLKTGYDYFEKERKLPKVSVDKDGRYVY